jgi:hypothetical protein
MSIAMALALSGIAFLIAANLIWFVVCQVSRVPSADETNQFESDLWKRYTGKQSSQSVATDDLANADRLLTYLERTIDRQINKARGVLPFNSLIMTFLALQRNIIVSALGHVPESIPLNVAYFLLVIALSALFASSLFCLYLFLVKWGSSAVYLTFEAEVSNSVIIIRTRSLIIQIATALAALGLVLAAISFITEEFITSAFRS